jgi:hypothetical protein
VTDLVSIYRPSNRGVEGERWVLVKVDIVRPLKIAGNFGFLLFSSGVEYFDFVGHSLFKKSNYERMGREPGKHQLRDQ